MVGARVASKSWSDIKKAFIYEIIPQDHSKRATDKPSRLKQAKFVGRYLIEFQKTIFTINGMHKAGKFGRILQGLKHQVDSELLKSQAKTVNKCTYIALNIDSAMRRVSEINKYRNQ